MINETQYQIVHVKKDRSMELVAQKGFAPNQDIAALREWITSVQKEHPAPEGADFALVKEGSRYGNVRAQSSPQDPRDPKKDKW